MKDSYPKPTEKALHGLIPFVSTYLCESGFSSLLQIKANKEINLMLKMTYDVHSLKLHLVFGCFSIGNKAKHRINSKVQINASLNMCISLLHLVVTRIVGTSCGRGGMKRFKTGKGRHATKEVENHCTIQSSCLLLEVLKTKNLAQTLIKQ